MILQCAAVTVLLIDECKVFNKHYVCHALVAVHHWVRF